jgi:hypothetical protein
MQHTKLSPARQKHVSEILRHLDLDSLLRQSVVLCDLELNGDGCSLFLIDDNQDTITLRESTVLTRYLDRSGSLRSEIDKQKVELITNLLAKHGIKPEDLSETLEWKKALSYGDEVLKELYRFGLTRWSLYFGCQMRIRHIHCDVRWSHFDPEPIPRQTSIQLPSDYVGTNKSSPMSHCELPPGEIASVAIVPIPGSTPDSAQKGILRQVWRKDRTKTVRCSKSDLEWMSWLARSVAERMESAISLTDLLDLGTKIEVEDFGDKVVKLLRRVLKAKGCSIFLETAAPEHENRSRAFRCIATTGLCDPRNHVGPEDDRFQLIEKKDAQYVVDPAQTESHSLTEWVITNGQLAAIEDIYGIVNLPGLEREPGPGKFSETDFNGLILLRFHNETNHSIMFPWLDHDKSIMNWLTRQRKLLAYAMI